MFLDIFHDVHSRATKSTGDLSDISLDKAELIAIFLEALLYGFEALTFVATVYHLHGAKRTSTLLAKFGSVILMFMLNTIHIGASLRRILNAFVGTADDPIPDAAAYLADLSGFLYRFQNIMIILQFIMLDVLVVYRCYMIWDKNIWVTLLPSFGIVAYIITGVASIHAFATDKSDTIFTGITRTWVSAMLCVTLFTKLVCFVTVVTATISSRPASPWHTVYLRVNRFPKLYKVLLVGVETGGLAVLGAVILIPIYLAGRNAQGIMLAAMSPLTGEAFLLIIMATLLGLTPSASGASRRRKGGGIPSPRIMVPPISISHTSTPTTRFSGGPLFKKPWNSNSPSTVSVNITSDGDYMNRSFGNTAEPPLACTNSRYSGGYVLGEPMPFSDAFVRQEDKQQESDSDTISIVKEPDMSLRDVLAFGDGESVPVSSSDTRGTFHLARSADGAVQVLQKEYSR
ncbi:hypothetical protein K439DRAFT_1631849 [Ramaria rubella]|nr:hypothetical protein K439DRAFT_1631849 [Ramaria rubella]